MLVQVLGSAAEAKVQLLFLSACHSFTFGEQSVDHTRLGPKVIPHVVCMTDAILDAHSLAFTRRFYESLGSGSTVKHAFEVALLEFSNGQEMAKYRLLPNVHGAHDVCLFERHEPGTLINLTPALPPHNIHSKPGDAHDFGSHEIYQGNIFDSF
jgi:hypothetical protein